MTTALLIVGCILAGAAMAVLVVFTLKWIKDRVKKAITERKARKVFITSLDSLANECDNKISLDDLEKLADGHNAFVVADVQYDGSLGQVDFVKDKNKTLDEEVAAFLKKEGKVVIEA